MQLRLTEADRVRFWQKVDKGDGTGCWLWTAGLQSAGYPSFWLDGRMVQATRLALHLAGYRVTAVHYGLHDCDTKRCVRVAPGHLKPGSQSENMHDWHERRKYQEPQDLEVVDVHRA